jgi:signal transduction histidine kinase
MAARAERRAARTRAWRDPALLLGLLLAVTAAATLIAAHRVDEREHDELVGRARSATQAIDRRMRDYAEILRGAAALYTSSKSVTPVEYRRFFASQGIKRRYPGVQGVLHATVVSAGDVPAFQARTRAADAPASLAYPRFTVHPRPTSPDQRLLVVDASTEATAGSAAFGLDLFTNLDRGRPARVALQSGEPAASAPLRLLRDNNRASLGLVLVAPIYTPASHAWAGVVYAAFRMDNLLRGVLGDLGPDVRTELFDLGPAATTPPAAGIGRHAVAYDLTTSADRQRRNGEHTRIENLTVGGRRWAVSYTNRQSLLPAGERSVPWVIAGAGLLVSLLAAALMRTLSTARQRAVVLAERMTVELREREAELQRSNAELEHFAYLASHDLQEPLRTITSYVGLLDSRAAEQLDDKARTWLGFVSDGAGRMSQLIADLLEYSRTGRSVVEPEPTSLEAAWDHAVANLQGAVAAAGASVTRDALPVVTGRERELTSVFQNLLANGLKYRGDRAPSVHASARRVDGRWEIAVADNGIGIDPRFHDRVFGLFQRLHTAEEYPGTGMGLAIVKKIAESNGGTVRVETTPGGGATFVVSLPAEHGP